MLESSFTSVADKGGGNINKIEIPERNVLIPHQVTEDMAKSSSDNIIDISGHEVTKIYKLGEKGSGIRLQSEIQDFEKLRKDCLSSGKLFEDPQFPAIDSSIFVNKRPDKYLKEIEWMRPKQIVDHPQLVIDGPSRFDVNQAIPLNNCWMVSSLSTIAMQLKLLQQILPQDQGFGDNYAGIFHVRFWQFGKWIEVVVDDRLPMYDGELLCSHSVKKNEFWCSIIEKAYAKLHGFWEALEFGYNREALEDFTGGIAQLWKTDNIPSDFFEIILEAQERNCLIGCIVENKDDEKIQEYRRSQGLVTGHAYGITKAVNLLKMVDGKIEKSPMLRLRNPWGFREWKGEWNDKSPLWDLIPEEVKKEIGFDAREDGEFWISFEDWKKHFDIVEICYLNLNYFMNRNYNVDGSKSWYTNSFEGEWVIGATAGGSCDDLDKFENNPQYRIKLNEESTVIIALMQRNRRTQRKEGAKFLMFGIDFFKLSEESSNELPRPLNVDYFLSTTPLEIESLKEGDTMIEKMRYVDHRQASCRIKLQPGTYFIIPNILKDNEEGEFLLRVFSQKPIEMEEYDDQIGEIENPIPSWYDEDEVKLKNIFRKLAGDDWEFDWREYKDTVDYELRKELSKDGFGKDASRTMVALLDADNSGKLGYREFRELQINLKRWKAAFDICDKNGSGYLEPFQLRKALKNAGYRLDNKVLNLLLRRYGTEDGHVKSDDYFLCAMKINKMIGAFKERAIPGAKSAVFTLGEWIETTLKT